MYLTPPPEIETATDLTEMPPDATQVVEVVPLLKDFVAAVDLHGIWLAVHHIYDEEADRLHDPLSKMIVATNLYLKMPASDLRRAAVYCGASSRCSRRAWSTPASTAPTTWWWFRR